MQLKTIASSLGLALGGMLAAMLITGRVSFQTGLLFVGLFAGVALFVSALTSFLGRQAAKERREFEAELAELSYEEAKLRALALVVSSGYSVVRNDGPIRSDLPVSLADIFGPYTRVSTPHGATLELGRSLSGMVEVAEADGTRVYARLGDGAIFEVDEDEMGPRSEPSYPSLAHWMVMNR